jgi:site-specific DNA recombinase
MGRREPTGTGRGRGLRCAIYTRKSSEEGLEQDFNSLDAQREACEAYIASQKHEGWVALTGMYDDGGFSGGTMDRPALKRLLADVAAGEIDVVVVYKVDRLTRSLADFAKIVEIFDGRKVSFVSVTQAFNTTSSMGRLTLNVLLSFAQFEREVTGERIRDKIAASKKKGMWMGGQPSLGYDVGDRKLVVNQAEAETVRHIFRRYQELRSVRLLATELEAEGVISKLRRAADGSPYGAKPLVRGALYVMLSNRIYRGEIVHKGTAFPGEHPAIVDEALWSEVQHILAANRVDRDTGLHASEPSLLAGLVFDAQGERLTPSHAVKKGTRYRYYVSQSLVTGLKGEQKDKGQRIPAANLEAIVKGRIRAFLADPTAILDAIEGLHCDAGEHKRIIDKAAQSAPTLTELAAQELRAFLLAAVSRIQVHAETIEISLDASALIRWLSDQGLGHATMPRTAAEHLVTLTIPARLRRTGLEMRLVIQGETNDEGPDPSLTRIMVRAHAIRDRLFQDGNLTVEEVARQEGSRPILRHASPAADLPGPGHHRAHPGRAPAARTQHPQADGRHPPAASTGTSSEASSDSLSLIPSRT